jgi:hypothetical protein
MENAMADVTLKDVSKIYPGDDAVVLPGTIEVRELLGEEILASFRATSAMNRGRPI